MLNSSIFAILSQTTHGEPNYMQIIGHRGACGYEPENTLSSFQKALELGVSMVELDVYALTTGELVVIHDDRVDRTTDGAGYVLDFSYEALRQLDAGKGQKIPLLSEVFDLIDKKAKVNIELKGVGTAAPVAELILSYKIEKGWSEELFVVSSFNHIELAGFTKRLPTIQTGALIMGIPMDYAAFAEKLGAFSANLSAEFISPEYVRDAHDRGLKVYVYPINNEPEIKRMQALQIDGVFSDYPDKVLSYLS
jgi:glycerophosphoryl diester phosphodiesterase